MPRQRKTYNHLYYLKNREQQLASAKSRYKEKREEILERQKPASKKYYQINKSKIKERQKTNWASNKDGQAVRKTERESTRYRKKRLEVFTALGGGECVKCGFTDWRALQIDHINGGGMRHIRSFTSHNKYFDYIKANLEKFQILCANCNRIKVHENKEFRKAAHTKSTTKSSEDT